VWDGDLLIHRLEDLTKELFNLHDLNSNGQLEEEELISLNVKIATLHHGKGANLDEVRHKYRTLFRAKLDPHGRSVPYDTFRAYAVEVLEGLDSDLEAQEMILEQFVAEARAGRLAMEADEAERREVTVAYPPVEMGWATFDPAEGSCACSDAKNSESHCATPSTTASSPNHECERQTDFSDAPAFASLSALPGVQLQEVFEWHAIERSNSHPKAKTPKRHAISRESSLCSAPVPRTEFASID
jgi:hypothetical protein